MCLWFVYFTLTNYRLVLCYMVVDLQHFKTDADATYVYSGLKNFSLMHLELGDNLKTIMLSFLLYLVAPRLQKWQPPSLYWVRQYPQGTGSSPVSGSTHYQSSDWIPGYLGGSFSPAGTEEHLSYIWCLYLGCFLYRIVENLSSMQHKTSTCSKQVLCEILRRSWA